MKKTLQRAMGEGMEEESETRNRQKKNNSFLLTVSSNIRTQTAKYNSGIQEREKIGVEEMSTGTLSWLDSVTVFSHICG